MAAMIQNDEEKEWMLPLLELRDRLDVRDDRDLRDFRRITGRIQLFHGRLLHGPYTQRARADWLRQLLEGQRWIRDHAPYAVRKTELITQEELREIRRIWVVDKHEFEDLLPRIYKQAMGEPFAEGTLDGHLAFGPEELTELRALCDSELEYEMLRDLLDVERRQKTSLRRHGLLDELQKTIERSFYKDADEAEAVALARNARRSGGAVIAPADDEFVEIVPVEAGS